MIHQINTFDGPFAFLSNFYKASVTFEGMTYPTNEHAFQAAKSLNKNIRSEFITQNLTPGQAKRKGRRLPLRPDWNSVKIQIMTDIVRNKFQTHPDLAAKLLATGDATLIEGTTWHDTFWGIDLTTNEGSNHLGIILMQIREELKQNKK